ncbi:7-cyano-7-deazaguanine synthase QueC [Thioflexithrix psekupsensis]|uniref:7-cyano-7-deazaguanine synthase n=1 Tax=Thioflexithrix psekupsensis TaxID=1570016 RepID=A0A251X5K0_9GAMM|nr:7-cyano-7-deazaguanine synthase QueC [Thioflexithrix psekupsensis]OUD12378.1 7-cyano-7-deazaguanine synthase QueC [Thioflexithrix psekupsensis]
MNSSILRKKAVILLSGGLDSATILAMAQQQDYDCYTLSFNYGQRHCAEIAAAQRIAEHFAVCDHKVIHLNLDCIGGSALTDAGIAVPITGLTSEIPVTYVPARNTVFLALALGWAEVLGARDIFIGVNAMDYSGYPDCRPAFIRQFEQLANVATKAGVMGESFHIHAPLLHWHKHEIIRHGVQLGVNYALTVSCYQANEQGEACGQCDACRLRRDGFAQAQVVDPTRYV